MPEEHCLPTLFVKDVMWIIVLSALFALGSEAPA